MALLNKLSDDQRVIYEALQSGKSIDQIAAQSGRPKSVIAAQCTRITNKGIQLPQTGQPTERQKQPEEKQPEEWQKQIEPHRPPTTGGSSNEQILREAVNAGPAVYNTEEILEKIKQYSDKNMNVRDVHPMVLLGVTIQYMKLCGGRMHAHQLIEDVYAAISTMAVDS